jgi:ABC-type antimicrobial peptide transport system permease subunit
MRLIDVIIQAFKNIGRQKLRSALTIFAVVIGATSVTIMLALVSGAKDFFYNQFESTGQLQQVVVNPQTDLDYESAHYGRQCSDCVKLNDDLAKKIEAIPHVVALARTMNPYPFEAVTYGGKKLNIESVQAYDASGVIQHQYAAGQGFSASDSTGKVLISHDYADKWGFKGNYGGIVGKQITFTTNAYFTGEGATLPDPVAAFKKCQNGGCDSSNGPPPGQAVDIPATVVGVLSDTDREIDLPLQWGVALSQNRRYEMTKADQEVFNRANDQWSRGGQRGPQPEPHFTLQIDNPIATNGYSTFIVKVDSAGNAQGVADSIKQFKVGALTAQSYIEQQLKIFQIISLVLGGIGGIALFVAAIGVINTMVMAILERTREIGILRACGATRLNIRVLFTIEAAVLGFLGGVLGVASGYGLTRIANVVINQQLTGNSIKAQNIIGLPLWLVVSVVGATTVIGMLAGLYPAFRASRLDPVEALRYE